MEITGKSSTEEEEYVEVSLDIEPDTLAGLKILAKEDGRSLEEYISDVITAYCRKIIEKGAINGICEITAEDLEIYARTPMDAHNR